MYFDEFHAVDKTIVAYNMHSGGPMVFIVDCKVQKKNDQNSLCLSLSLSMSLSISVFLCLSVSQLSVSLLCI